MAYLADAVRLSGSIYRMNTLISVYPVTRVFNICRVVRNAYDFRDSLVVDFREGYHGANAPYFKRFF